MRSFSEFRRRFGDIWSRSSLGPAVQQFFEHGGKNLYIVRVANNARGAMVCLPASGSALLHGRPLIRMGALYLTVAEINLSDAADRGITVTEIAAMDQPIDVLRETTAAFIGRALRGPINEPVFVRSFSEFRRRFGDIWSRSSLGPAVQQFFEHGGKNLYIVRVANNARGAM